MIEAVEVCETENNNYKEFLGTLKDFRSNLDIKNTGKNIKQKEYENAGLLALFTFLFESSVLLLFLSIFK